MKLFTVKQKIRATEKLFDSRGNVLASTLFAVFAIFVFIYCFVYLPFSILSSRLIPLF